LSLFHHIRMTFYFNSLIIFSISSVVVFFILMFVKDCLNAEYKSFNGLILFKSPIVLFIGFLLQKLPATET
jgi:hypothetical protein